MGNRKQISIGIIGGGASGMMAAITASKQGAKVTLLEGGDRVGRKILSTGNGKCNLGNENLSVEEYNGADPSWIQACLAEFDVQAAKAFFAEAGLLLKDKNGYLYPYAEQAAVVLDVLRRGLAETGVRVVTECKVQEIRWCKTSGTKFTAVTEQGSYTFDKIILACGSKAAPKTGSDGSGYKLSESMGHKIVPVVPALVQLRCRETFLKEVAGVRAEALLTVSDVGLETGRKIDFGAEFDTGADSSTDRIREFGELQLTDYGISGIPVFQLSRKVNYILQQSQRQQNTSSGRQARDAGADHSGKRSAEVEVKIDFLPEFSPEEVNDRFLTQRKQDSWGDQTVEEFFTGILNKKLMYLFIKLSGLKRDEKLRTAVERETEVLYDACFLLLLHPVKDTDGYKSFPLGIVSHVMHKIVIEMISPQTLKFLFKILIKTRTVSDHIDRKSVV